MKKYIIFLITLFIWGCGKDYDNVVDPVTEDFRVGFITEFSQFNYTVNNTAMTLRILISSGVRNVHAVISKPDGSLLEGTPVNLYDNGSSGNGDTKAGDKIYSAIVAMQSSYQNGRYTVDYYAEFEKNADKKIGSHVFVFNNGQDQIPPVISNLSAPDSVKASDTESTLIPLSIEVTDSNGVDDIKSVYFITYNSQGITDGKRTLLLDRGLDGNQPDNDGIYSTVLEFTPTNKKDKYRFEFEAEDWSGYKSNKIIHYIRIY